MRKSKTTKPGSQQQDVVLPRKDCETLEDYKAFRKARAMASMKSSEWNRMSKKTRRALAQMFDALAKQHNKQITDS